SSGKSSSKRMSMRQGSGPMIAPDLDTAKSQLEDLVHKAGTIVPFTGAGISTECGIPDFRSPGGLWTKNKPIPYDEFLASQEARNESWRRRFAMADQFGDARPGRGRRAGGEPLSRRQGSRRHHPEHRQSPSSVRVFPATRGRAARQYDL